MTSTARAAPVDSFFDIGADEFLDTDGDTLSDWFERGYDGDPTTYDPYDPSTNPTGTDLDYTNADTDGDGVNDGDEISGGTDPNDPNDPSSYNGPWYVDIDATGANSGTSWTDAFTNIQDAINAAAAGEEVWVAEGTYPESLTMKTGVAVYGGFAGTESLLSERDWRAHIAIIDAGTADGGGAAYHAVVMDAITDTRLDGLTIIGGEADGTAPDDAGGGVYCSNVDATNTMVNCTVSGNTSANGGGGIWCITSSPMLQGCVISGNATTTYGGGGIGCYSSSPSLVNCTIAGNDAQYGGGIGCDGGASPALANCTVSGNTADFLGGGGIAAYGASMPVLTNTIFVDNSPMAVDELDSSSDITATNCLFYGNADGDWYNEFSQTLTGAAAINALAEATDCVDGDPLFQMYSTQAVWGTWTSAPVFASGRTTLTDSSAAFTPGALAGAMIVCDTSQNMQALITSNTATTIEVAGDVTSYATNGDTYVLVDYHLMSGSAAINGGTATGAPADDFDGESRPVDSFFDIGVDEFLDTDGDTLSDWLEIGYDGDWDTYDPYDPSTNPSGTDLDYTNADTDGDGINDGTEVMLGTDPNDEGDVPSSGEVWVQFNYSSGVELGTSSQPFNALAEGAICVNAGGTIKIKGDTGDPDTTEAPRITKQMRIEAIGGTVRIGAP